MPVGAMIGGAAITGGTQLIAGSKASKAQSKAADKAADTSLAVADKNNALYREIHGENKALLTPYSERGLAASNALSDLLLGTSYSSPAPASPAPSVAGAGTGALSAYSSPGTRTRLRDEWGLDPSPEGNFPNPATPSGPASASSGDGGPSSALSAWDRFREGTNYQWRLGEGQRALDSSYAGKGMFESGAADKARIKYGQNFASNDLANYMNLLANQQAMGMGAASAVAGVGQNYANSVAAQNTAAGNAAANAALVAGQGAANTWGAVGQGVGQIGGALYQYGMGQMPRTTFAPAALTASGSGATPLPSWGGF